MNEHWWREGGSWFSGSESVNGDGLMGGSTKVVEGSSTDGGGGEEFGDGGCNCSEIDRKRVWFKGWDFEWLWCGV